MSAGPGTPLADGLLIDRVSPDQLGRTAVAALARGESMHLVTVNPEIAVAARRNPRYRAILDACDVRTADGVGVALAAAVRSRRRWPRLTGGEITEVLSCLSVERGLPLVLIGGSQGSREGAERTLAARGARLHPGWSGPVGAEGQGIEAAAPAIPRRSVVLVALGAPKCDFAIDRLRRMNAGPAVFVGIGGVLDYLSGTARVPPRWIRRLGMEWAFRLALAPRIRLRRQLVLPLFVLQELGLAS